MLAESLRERFFAKHTAKVMDFMNKKSIPGEIKWLKFHAK